MIIDIYSDTNFKNKEELFEAISKRLLKDKYVNNSFLEAIKSREHDFPTGLKGKIRNIAIPHTDPKHVNKSAYIVISNKKPIEFEEMANKDSILNVKLIIIILSENNFAHMDLLKKSLNLANLDIELTKENIKSYLKNKEDKWKKY